MGMEEEWLTLKDNQAWQMCSEEWQDQLKAMEAQIWTSETWEAFLELRGRRAGLLSALRVMETLLVEEEVEVPKYY